MWQARRQTDTVEGVGALAACCGRGTYISLGKGHLSRKRRQVCRAADRMTSRFPPGSQGLQVYLLPRAADSCPKHPLPVNIPITPNRGCPRTTLRLNVT